MPGSPESNKPNHEWRAPPRPQPESAANPFALLSREQSGGDEWSHEQLVQAFRHLIRKQQRFEETEGENVMGGHLHNPASIIGMALGHQSTIDIAKPRDPLEDQRLAFFTPISNAWTVIAHEHFRFRRQGQEYKGGGSRSAFLLVYDSYQRALARGEPRPEIITLDPQQVKILDALAEAADVPHQRGQAEIEIPEDLRH